MRALGIVLVVFNLLAAGGFGYLAVQDWKGRQTITAAGLRHVLLLAGLPMGDRPDDPQALPPDPEAEIPFHLELAGGVPTTTVSKKLLESYFTAGGQPGATAAAVTAGTVDNKAVSVGPMKSLGGGVVPNQLAEVRRVFAEVQKQVSAADGQAARATLLGGWLAYQPETYEERVEVLRLVEQQNAAELQRRLYARFEQLISAPGGPAPAAPPADPGAKTTDPAAGGEGKAAAKGGGRLGAVRDAADRRAKLAHLLVHLDTDPGWQKRVMMVVGLRRYVHAITAQVVRFRDMAGRVADQADTDSRVFEAQHAQLERLSRERTEVLMDATRERAELERQRDRAKAQVADVTTELDGGRGKPGLRRQLEEVKAEVDGMLAQQTAIERRLFDVQKEVALTLEDIYQLEAELERLERARFGPAKK